MRRHNPSFPRIKQDGYNYVVIQNLYYPLHIHDELECVYLIDGKVTAIIEEDTLHLKPGDFCVALPNQLHRYQPSQYSRALMFVIHPDVFPMADRWLLDKHLSSSVFKAGSYPAQCDDILQEMTSPNPPVSLDGLGKLISLIGLLFAQREPLPGSSTSNSDVRRVLDYMISHKRLPLSLSQCAEELGLSQFQLSRIFNQQIGMSFRNYLRRIRIIAAKRDLAYTRTPILQIAQSLGFESVRTFNRAFAEETNMSPSVYRKLSAQQPELDFSSIPAFTDNSPNLYSIPIAGKRP